MKIKPQVIGTIFLSVVTLQHSDVRAQGTRGLESSGSGSSRPSQFSPPPNRTAPPPARVTPSAPTRQQNLPAIGGFIPSLSGFGPAPASPEPERAGSITLSPAGSVMSRAWARAVEASAEGARLVQDLGPEGLADEISSHSSVLGTARQLAAALADLPSAVRDNGTALLEQSARSLKNVIREKLIRASGGDEFDVSIQQSVDEMSELAIQVSDTPAGWAGLRERFNRFREGYTGMVRRHTGELENEINHFSGD